MATDAEMILQPARLRERPTRVAAFEHCTITRDNGSYVGGVLLNLSTYGFCVQVRQELEVGERVQVQVDGLGSFTGVVRWHRSNRAGFALEQIDETESYRSRP